MNIFISPGLYNDSLDHQKDFDDDLVDLMTSFLRRLDPPVCLLAHNGNRFDFRLLRAELARISKALPDVVLCADTLDAFRCLDGLSPLGRHPQPIQQEALDRINSASTTPSTRGHCSPSILPENIAKVKLSDFVSKQNNNNNNVTSDDAVVPSRDKAEVNNVKRKLFSMNTDDDTANCDVKRPKCVNYIISGDKEEVDKVKRKLFCDEAVGNNVDCVVSSVNSCLQLSLDLPSCSSDTVVNKMSDIDMVHINDKKLPTIEESTLESKPNSHTTDNEVKIAIELTPSNVPNCTSGSTYSASTESSCVQTPVSSRMMPSNNSASPTRSIFPTPNSSEKRRLSYSLKELHKRITAHYPPDSHFAESDCMALLNIVHRKSSDLLGWFDRNAVPFNSIDFLYTPKPRKCLDPGVFPYH